MIAVTASDTGAIEQVKAEDYLHLALHHVNGALLDDLDASIARKRGAEGPGVAVGNVSVTRRRSHITG